MIPPPLHSFSQNYFFYPILSHCPSKCLCAAQQRNNMTLITTSTNPGSLSIHFKSVHITFGEQMCIVSKCFAVIVSQLHFDIFLMSIFYVGHVFFNVCCLLFCPLYWDKYKTDLAHLTLGCYELFEVLLQNRKFLCPVQVKKICCKC